MMNEKYIIETVPGSNPLQAQIMMNKMDQQGYKVLAVSHGHVSGSICFIITFDKMQSQNTITQITNNLDIEAKSTHTPEGERATYSVRFNTIKRAPWGNAERDMIDYEMTVIRTTSRSAKTYKVNIYRDVVNNELADIEANQVRNERGNTVFNHDKYQGFIDAAMAHVLAVETAALEAEDEDEAEVEDTAEATAQKIARESSDFGWELSPEFVEALADEIGRAHEQGEEEGFNGVETFLAYFGGAVQNARF